MTGPADPTGNGTHGGKGGKGGQPRPTEADPERLRELLLVAGLEVLERDGLGLGTQALSYRQVFAHLRDRYGVSVARAQVHERIWTSHDEFRQDVVAATISHLPTDLMAPIADEVRDRVVEQWLLGHPVDQRITEISRWMAPAAFDVIASLPALREVQLAKAIATSGGSTLRADELGESLRDRGDSILAGTRSRLTQLTSGLGLRARRGVVDEGTAQELLGVISINCNVGGFLDVNAGSDDVRRPLALDGLEADAELPWTMVAVGMISVLRLLFEPDDGPPPSELPEPLPIVDTAPPRIAIDPTVRRRSRAQLRKLVLAAGVETLLEARLDLRPESLSYASVFEHLERSREVRVYRSSVHRRIWNSHDEYWLDVLTRALQHGAEPDINVLERLESREPLPVGSPTERRRAAMGIVRWLTATDTATSLASSRYLRRQSIKAALMAEPDAEPFASLRQVVHRTGGRRVECLQKVFRSHVLPLGYEVRPERGVDTEEALRILSVLYLTAAAGAVFDQASGVEPSGRTYPVRFPDMPAPEQWPAISVATWAVFDHLFRVRDDTA